MRISEENGGDRAREYIGDSVLSMADLLERANGAGISILRTYVCGQMLFALEQGGVEVGPRVPVDITAVNVNGADGQKPSRRSSETFVSRNFQFKVVRGGGMAVEFWINSGQAQGESEAVVYECCIVANGDAELRLFHEDLA